MPKSGKFVIKKTTSQGNDLVRNHLQKKDSTAGAGAPASDAPAGEDEGGECVRIRLTGNGPYRHTVAIL